MILDESSWWDEVHEAAESLPDHGIIYLAHPAKQLYLFKRKNDDVITRRLTDTKPLSERLRLRGAMFNHHMPWGYNALFTGYGLDHSLIDMSILEELEARDEIV